MDCLPLKWKKVFCNIQNFFLHISKATFIYLLYKYVRSTFYLSKSTTDFLLFAFSIIAFLHQCWWHVSVIVGIVFKMTDRDFPIRLRLSNSYAGDIQKLLSHCHKPACGTLSFLCSHIYWLNARRREEGGGLLRNIKQLRKTNLFYSRGEQSSWITWSLSRTVSPPPPTPLPPPPVVLIWVAASWCNT